MTGLEHAGVATALLQGAEDGMSAPTAERLSTEEVSAIADLAQVHALLAIGDALRRLADHHGSRP
jgi:hypothetical protein